MKQVNRTGSGNRPLTWIVLEILVDSAVWELEMESGHLLLGFAGELDTYKKRMMDIVVAWVQHFHGRLGWGYSLDVGLAVSSPEKKTCACPEEMFL